MSRQARGAYLYLRRAHGTRKPVWIIRDGAHRESTGCGPGQSHEAQRKLAAYITAKYQVPRIKDRDPDAIPVGEVIKIYADEVGRDNSRPKELGERLMRVEAFFGEPMLSEVTKTTCKAYAEHRGKPSAARRELEDLRSAIGYYGARGCAPPRSRYGCRGVASHVSAGSPARKPLACFGPLIGIARNSSAI